MSDTNNCMMINPDANPATLQDGITERLIKIDGILVALAADDNETLSWRLIRNVIWTLETLNDEVRELNKLQWQKLMAEKIKASRALHGVDEEDQS